MTSFEVEFTKRKAGSVWLLVSAATLVALSGAFFYAQNHADHIGGPMSFAKLLWLDYALIAWFLVPTYFWRSTSVSPALRRIYGWHLTGFAIRGIVELWLLYVTHSWIPPYGIAHDLGTIALITMLLATAPRDLAPNDGAARRFLTSIRIGLMFEIAFAWLFFQAVQGQTARTWFASDDPVFRFINALTWVAVLLGYFDLWRAIRREARSA